MRGAQATARPPADRIPRRSRRAGRVLARDEVGPIEPHGSDDLTRDAQCLGGRVPDVAHQLLLQVGVFIVQLTNFHREADRAAARCISITWTDHHRGGVVASREVDGPVQVDGVDNTAQVSDPGGDIGDTAKQRGPLLVKVSGHLAQFADGRPLYVGSIDGASAIQASRSSRSITVIFGERAEPFRFMTYLCSGVLHTHGTTSDHRAGRCCVAVLKDFRIWVRDSPIRRKSLLGRT